MPEGVTASEMLRLTPAVAPTPLDSQNDLGVLAGDNAGFPNGRRPVDDVVDIALRVVMGVLLDEESAPAGQIDYTDGAVVDRDLLLSGFPYLGHPFSGSPNPQRN